MRDKETGIKQQTVFYTFEDKENSHMIIHQIVEIKMVEGYPPIHLN